MLTDKTVIRNRRKIAAGDNRRELIEQYTNLEHLTREIVEYLIDYISVDNVFREQRTFRLKFTGISSLNFINLLAKVVLI